MKDLIRKIKYSRLKPEERFLIDLISNLKKSKYKNMIYYRNNEKILLFIYHTTNHWLEVSDSRI